MVPHAPPYIYRIGYEIAVGSFKHRCIVSETWASEDAEISIANTINGLSFPHTNIAHPFGPFSAFDLKIDAAASFVQQVVPWHGWRVQAAHTVTFPHHFPNFSAPEACFVLQRVGGSAGALKHGRIMFPIMNDIYFTDLPRRRKVDIATLRPMLTAAHSSKVFSWTAFGRTYVNCIYHRRTNTYTAVDHYELRENPGRVWQRNEEYFPAAHRATDLKFNPQEASWFSERSP
jgi:hypothetical protein